MSKTPSQSPAPSSPVAFSVGQLVVYPAHGVGEVVGVEEQSVAGMTMRLYVLSFDKERLQIKVPVARSASSGMRAVTGRDDMERALEVLSGRPKNSKLLWSKRALEYDGKVNSGNVVQLCEVVRDLFRAANQPEPSYSERQIWEGAVNRLARECSASLGTTVTEAVRRIETTLATSKYRKQVEESAQAAEAA